MNDEMCSRFGDKYLDDYDRKALRRLRLDEGLPLFSDRNNSSSTNVLSSTSKAVLVSRKRVSLSSVPSVLVRSSVSDYACHTMPGPNTPLSLASLPTELHLAILPHLQYDSLSSLRAVNRHFSSVVSLEMITAALQRHQEVKRQLVRAEHAQYRKEWVFDDAAHDVSDLGIESHVCYTCLEEKPSGDFTEKHVIKKRARGGPFAIKRFCINCGLKKRWNGGTVIESWRKFYVVCVACKELKIAVVPGRKVKWSVCLDCWTQSGTRDGLWVEGLGMGDEDEAEGRKEEPG